MARRAIIYIISAFIMIFGIKNVLETFLPFFDPTQPKELFLFVSGLISSAFIFFIVWSLVRLNELGRKLAFWFVFVPLTGAVLLIFILILPPDSHFAIHIRFLGKMLFDSENNHLLSIIFMFVLLVINTTALFFLGQKETKKIFLSEKADDIVSKANFEQG